MPAALWIRVMDLADVASLIALLRVDWIGVVVVSLSTDVVEAGSVADFLLPDRPGLLFLL